MLWPTEVVRQALAEVRELHRRVDALERHCSTSAETADVLRGVDALRSACIDGGQDGQRVATDRLLASFWRLERAVKQAT
jgi:hypothetical protein